VDDRGEVLGKQEFRVKDHAEVPDLGTPWDDSLLHRVYFLSYCIDSCDYGQERM
jgi:hypothetical protein